MILAVDAESASREDALDLVLRIAIEFDDGRRIDDAWERESNFAFMVAIDEDDSRSLDDRKTETFEWFRDALLELDLEELQEIAATLRDRDLEVPVAELANAPRELDLTERAAEAIREAIARDLRLDAELGE
jgi:hypothetical protein